MLKAIVTVLDENDRILQANRLIFEENSVPIGYGFVTGIEHKFCFTVVTSDEETTYKLNKIGESFTLRADEIREERKNDMDIDDGGINEQR